MSHVITNGPSDEYLRRLSKMTDEERRSRPLKFTDASGQQFTGPALHVVKDPGQRWFLVIDHRSQCRVYVASYDPFATEAKGELDVETDYSMVDDTDYSDGDEQAELSDEELEEEWGIESGCPCESCCAERNAARSWDHPDDEDDA